MTLNRGAACLCLFALVGAASPTLAQRSEPVTIGGLGTISFPVSTGSATAESSFVRGVLLVHLFEYDAAAAAFREARQLDPRMAMASWGEAMTRNHPVWDEQDSVAARAVLARLGVPARDREARGGTDIERGFLHAVDILYGPGPKARRDTLYADAMGALLRRHPNDDEVRSFYTLALLGLSQGVRNVPTYLHAAAIAESVFARNPRHPGAAHYWIHGMDDPEHAAGALPAARTLSVIAPDAGHAQHMTQERFAATTDPGDAEYLQAVDVRGLQLRADVLAAAGSNSADSVVALLHEAAAMEDAMPYAFGPPMIDKPTHERLGEALLHLGKAADAKREFEAALRITPNRALALCGLERAKAMLAAGAP